MELTATQPAGKLPVPVGEVTSPEPSIDTKLQPKTIKPCIVGNTILKRRPDLSLRIARFSLDRQNQQAGNSDHNNHRQHPLVHWLFLMLSRGDVPLPKSLS